MCKVSELNPSQSRSRKLSSGKSFLTLTPSSASWTSVHQKNKKTKTPVSMPCCALICREAMQNRHLVNALEVLSRSQTRKNQEKQKLHPNSIAIFVVVF
jgi:hypothetical protein